ncbi:MAG: hypothetical protein ACTFAK_13835 [Candidatus Electronema sp. VV]
MTESGILAEIFLSLGVYSGINSLYDFFYIPVSVGRIMYGDEAYNACKVEDELEQSGIHLNPRKKIKEKI